MLPVSLPQWPLHRGAPQRAPERSPAGKGERLSWPQGSGFPWTGQVGAGGGGRFLKTLGLSQGGLGLGQSVSHMAGQAPAKEPFVLAAPVLPLRPGGEAEGESWASHVE